MPRGRAKAVPLAQRPLTARTIRKRDVDSFSLSPKNRREATKTLIFACHYSVDDKNNCRD